MADAHRCITGCELSCADLLPACWISVAALGWLPVAGWISLRPQVSQFLNRLLMDQAAAMVERARAVVAERHGAVTGVVLDAFKPWPICAISP